MKWFNLTVGIALALICAPATTGPPNANEIETTDCFAISIHVQPAIAETIEEGVARESLADEVGTLDATAFIMRTDPTSGARAMMALSIVTAATTANIKEGVNAYPILAST